MVCQGGGVAETVGALACAGDHGLAQGAAGADGRGHHAPQQAPRGDDVGAVAAVAQQPAQRGAQRLHAVVRCSMKVWIASPPDRPSALPHSPAPVRG